MKTVKSDVVVLGAGAGGFGTVYALLKSKKNVIVVDENSSFGGTAVFSGVSCWEPGCSGFGVHRKIAKILTENGQAAVGTFVPNINLFSVGNVDNYLLDFFYEDRSKRPWVLSDLTKEDYSQTEKRCYITRNGGRYYRRFQFLPQGLNYAMNKVLEPYKENLTAFFNAKFLSANKKEDKILSVDIKVDGETIRLNADYFVDASGDVALCRGADVEVSFGRESKESYGEPSAPKTYMEDVNGVSKIFLIKKSDENYIDETPEKYREIDVGQWKKDVVDAGLCISFMNANTDGTISVNMLPTMNGGEYFSLKEKATDILIARVYAYWNYLQRTKGLKGFKIVKIFDKNGIRESFRIKGKYVLSENEARKGYLKQEKREEFIAYSDHPFDSHGELAFDTDGTPLEVELNEPFGIPFSCTQVKEFSNLFVACRGISSTHIVNSSLRLQRTLMCVGEGVGYAVAQLIDSGRVDFPLLQQKLKIKEYERFLESEESKYRSV